MASLVKRGGRWTATARLPDTFQGLAKSKSISQTFIKKSDARLWLESTEAAMKLGTWIDPRLEVKQFGPLGWPDKTFEEAIETYRDVETPKKKGASQERSMLNMFIREDFAKKKIRELTVSDFVEYRDKRMTEDGKSESTVRNNLNTVSAIFEWLIYSKSVDVKNPIVTLRKIKRGIPQPKGHRERRLRIGEADRLTAAINSIETPTGRQWAILFPLLLDTGMRLGEALSLKCGWLREQENFVVIPDSKNGSRRHVALSDRSYEALMLHIEKEPDDSKVFRFSEWTAKNEWRNDIRIAAEAPDLRIHDLRHEALSSMASRGADLKTLMRQSGHKTVAVLMRYLNPTPEEQRKRLFGSEN
ncbi:tyrosine-type recombinase/integrase [Brucella pituitosa]|uniref:Site-specific integrase n=1 Tax=Brucella pituitosa TaxID=571256 RepID=A0ABS3JZT6_9HYPH|nr:site-specific integrase [Brucella pituitosa]MBO1040193.1 site-specific integrase [Brucella pituitosa]